MNTKNTQSSSDSGSYRKVKRRGKQRSGHAGLSCLSIVLTVIMVAFIGTIWFLDQFAPEDFEEGNLNEVMKDSIDQMIDAIPNLPDHNSDEVTVPSAPSGKSGGYSVSTSCPYATQAAVRILESGGNAVDAAIAVSYTLSVSEPYASGLGGGGCMVVYDPQTKEFTFYNYGAEVAQSGNSWLALVPGFVSGMEAIRSDFATKDLAELLEPALECCDGVVINEIAAMRIDTASGNLSHSSPFYGENGFLKEGDLLVQQELKQTLQRLIEEGPGSFYTGSIAQDIADATSLSMEDLAAYQTIKTKPVTGTYNGYTIGAAAAPFSGATLIQMLKMADVLDLPDPDTDPKAFLSGLKTISQTSQYDRIYNIYDLRFGGENVNQDSLVSDSYIAELLGLDVSDFVEEEECEDTTAFTIVDKDGMVVACTNTLSSFFGCYKEVDGFYMNNTGYLFGSNVNARQNGKRPRTHISPAILVSEDEVIAVASPGGNRITRVLANVLMDVCQYGEAPQTAVDKQRLLFVNGDVLYYEVGYDTPLFAKVSGSGYPAVAYSYHSYFGNVSLAGWNSTAGYYAAEDVRRCGSCTAANP